MQLIARSYAGIGPADVAAALEGGTTVRVPLRPPCPSLLLRAELQNYFREARNRLEVRAQHADTAHARNTRGTHQRGLHSCR
jgi:hypothetical protein